MTDTDKPLARQASGASESVASAVARLDPGALDQPADGDQPGELDDFRGDRWHAEPDPGAPADADRGDVELDDGDDLLEVKSQLVDTFIAEGRHQEAFGMLAELEAAKPNDLEILARKANILRELQRPGEALPILERLAKMYEIQGRHDRLPALYYQILSIAPGRRKIAKALYELQGRAPVRRMKVIAISGASFVAILLGIILYSSFTAAGRRAQLTAEVDQRIASNELDAALALLDSTAGDASTVAELRDKVLALMGRSSANTKEGGQVEDLYREGSEQLQRGDIRNAVETYSNMLQATLGTTRKNDVNGSFDGYARRLDDLATKLLSLIPDPPDLDQTDAQREKILSEFDNTFRAIDLQLANNALQMKESTELLRLISKERRDRLVAAANRLVDCFKQVDVRKKEYVDAREQSDVARSLSPLYESALDHEKQLRFGEALKAYQSLVADHPDQGHVKAHFRNKVAFYTKVVEDIGEAEKHTAAGDFSAAHSKLLELEELYPQLPLRRIVHLPLRVTSTPAGALVTINGTDIGRTPLRTGYLPFGQTTVQVTLLGYESAETTFREDGAEELVARLSKAPTWAFQAKGSVQHQPVFDDVGRAFITDRSGSLTAIQVQNGEIVWSIDTGDLSGLLPRPVVYQDLVIVASVDGKLRALDRASGAPRWERAGLPCEGAPALVGSTVVLGTTAGEVVGLRANNGAPMYRVSLPGELRTAVQPNGSSVVVATSSGLLTCLRATDGKEQWKFDLKTSMAVGPCVGSGVVAAVSDDGRVVVLRAQDGQKVWIRGGLEEPKAAPVIAGRLLVVAGYDSLRTFHLQDAQLGPTYKGTAPWSGDLVVAGRRLYVGSRDGQAVVLDAATLALLYLVRGKDRVAPIGVGEDGRVIVGFGDWQVQGFSDLK